MKTTRFVLASAFCFFALCARTQTGTGGPVSVTTQFVSVTPNAGQPGTCELRLNLSWEQKSNDSNAYAYLHIWPSASYRSLTYAHAPLAADLQETIGTLVIKDPSSATPVLQTTYNPDLAYANPLAASGNALPLLRKTTANGVNRFSVENLVLSHVPYNTENIYQFVADVWQSRQSPGQTVEGVSKNIGFATNEIISRTAALCTSEALTLQLFSRTAATGTVKLYADLGAAGKFEPAADALLREQPYSTGTLPGASGAWTFRYASAVNVPVTNRQNNFWVEVRPAGSNAGQVFFVANGCTMLPEKLALFTANRVHGSVVLNWETISEQNSRGFEVMRKTTGDWEKIAFVPSNAGGNSNEKVSYFYTDANNFRGISQYQLAEVTNQGQPRLSGIKAVKGEGQPGRLMLFPNPATNGRATLVFESNGLRDVSVFDAGGREVKTFRAVRDASLSMDDLKPGFYTIRIRVQATNEIFAEKLLVAAR